MRCHNKHIWGLSFPLTSLNSVTWFEGQSHMTDCIVTLELTYGIQRTWIKKYKPKRKASWKDLGKKEGSYVAFHTYTHAHLDSIGCENIPSDFSSWTQSQKQFQTHFQVCAAEPLSPQAHLSSQSRSTCKFLSIHILIYHKVEKRKKVIETWRDKNLQDCGSTELYSITSISALS